MFQDFHAADVQGLALYLIGCRQCEILDPNPAGSKFPGQFLAFQSLESLRLSGCIHDGFAKYRFLGLRSICLFSP
jgi:hypothetical protein